MENISSDDRIKKIVIGIIGNNKKMILDSFGEEGEITLQKITEEISNEIFGENQEILKELTSSINEVQTIEEVLLCVKI